VFFARPLWLCVLSRQRKPPLHAWQLQGFKYFSLLCPLVERLHDDGCGPEQAGNRLLFYDQYAALLLLYFFSPVLRSLRGRQPATALDKVQKRLGVRRTSLGSLGQASRVFDPERLPGLAEDLAAQVLPKDQEALRGLTAVDGSGSTNAQTTLSVNPKAHNIVRSNNPADQVYGFDAERDIFVSPFQLTGP
jgi:hypothetical protein